MVSQQLKKQKVGHLECSAVPEGMSGGRSGARSGLGCTTGLPRGFNFINRVSWMASNISNIFPLQNTENWIVRIGILGENTIV